MVSVSSGGLGGSTREFLLSSTRDAQAAKRFFLSVSHTIVPRVITVDNNAAYPKALTQLQAEDADPIPCELRQVKYLNNLIEQDHRFIKRLVKPGLGFGSVRLKWPGAQFGDMRPCI